jgi:hypothetical protein
VRWLLLALLAAPTAAALDALPATLGPREGSVVVRAQGPIRVAADAPLEVAVNGSFVAAPADLAPPPGASWHGIPGAVEVRLRRPDAQRAVRVELDDGATGVVVEWPAARVVPGASAASLAGAGLAAGLLAGRRRLF